MGTGVPFGGVVVKKPGNKFNHSPPFSAEVKNEWSYTSTLLHAFMAQNRETFTSITFSEELAVS